MDQKVFSNIHLTNHMCYDGNSYSLVEQLLWISAAWSEFSREKHFDWIQRGVIYAKQHCLRNTAQWNEMKYIIALDWQP